MDESYADGAAASIAAEIGEPGLARMLYCLLDNHARTGTELAVIAEFSPSTASVHLNRLKTEGLVKVVVQGKHRYYRLQSAAVARVLEGLSVLAGGARPKFVPHTPDRLRAARTCYDHIAGTLGVLLHDRLEAGGWLSNSYDLTAAGVKGFEALGVDIAETRGLHRRFAFPCLDWSERRFHLAGRAGAALARHAIGRGWVRRKQGTRAVIVTAVGATALHELFDIGIA